MARHLVHWSADGIGTVCKRYMFRPSVAVSWSYDRSQVTCKACLKEKENK